MKFAIVDNQKITATPKKQGVCQCCNSKVIAKCGNKKIWHWSHVKSPNCDPWWENETEWHRTWKSYFKSENQEVIHYDQDTGEKHIADVKTDNNMVIEFQNSTINEQELHSRENFYKKMFWIVNGLKFLNNFSLGAKLPSPFASEMTDVQIIPSNDKSWLGIWLRSENPDHKPGWLVEMNVKYNINELVERTFDGHYLFKWKNRRTVWFNSKMPVFLDFGGETLLRLKNFGGQPFNCVRVVSKAELILKNGGSITLNN